MYIYIYRYTVLHTYNEVSIRPCSIQKKSTASLGCPASAAGQGPHGGVPQTLRDPGERRDRS